MLPLTSASRGFRVAPAQIWIVSKNMGTPLKRHHPKSFEIAVQSSTTISCRSMLTRPQSMRSEEHTSELQSLMRISYAVFCLKKKKKKTIIINPYQRTTTDTKPHKLNALL